jgi:hypothetical protein
LSADDSNAAYAGSGDFGMSPFCGQLSFEDGSLASLCLPTPCMCGSETKAQGRVENINCDAVGDAARRRSIKMRLVLCSAAIEVAAAKNRQSALGFSHSRSKRNDFAAPRENPLHIISASLR